MIPESLVYGVLAVVVVIVVPAFLIRLFRSPRRRGALPAPSAHATLDDDGVRIPVAPRTIDIDPFPPPPDPSRLAPPTSQPKSDVGGRGAHPER